jgi:hypothetical protein
MASAASCSAGMRLTTLLLTGLLALLAGCPPSTGRAPVDRREALERVNDNLSEMNAPLQCTALVSFSFRDAEGKMHRFIGHEARLIFQTPQSLLFDVRSLAGTVAQFGSNDDRYWLWIDVPDLRKLWWGHWQRVSADSERKLPVPPNELLDALMLRPLPESLEGGQLPVLRIEGEDHRLTFIRLSAARQPIGWREIRLDPRPPYQPLEVIDRLPDGPIVMRAQLMDYRRVGSDGAFTPRRYIVVWPRNDAEMRLDILQATLRPELPADVFEFPSGWQAEREQIDAPPESGARK